MKQSTNKYRKCANCPHSAIVEQKCCCQRSSASTLRNKPMTSRPKKQQSTIDNSSIVNTTIPTLMAQFSALRTQNNQLKRQIMHVSAFLKDEPHSSISTCLNEPSINQKLFIANKNLKELLIEVDNLSKINKQLCDRNTHLSEQCEGLKIQTRQIEGYLDRYKKKCRKYSKALEQMPNHAQIQDIIKLNVDLQEQNRSLKQQIRVLKFQNNNFNMIGNLSPEWVAHTNNKISKNQHNVMRLEGQREVIREDELEIFKKSLSQTINLLKNESTHFHSVLFNNVGSVEMIGLQQLIQNLIQTYSESIFGHFSILIKEINRKMNNYEKKMANLTCKLENFLIIFRNKKMKKVLPSAISFIKTDRRPAGDITNRF